MKDCEWSCRLWLPAVAMFITLGEGLQSQVARAGMQEPGVPVPESKKTLSQGFLICLWLCICSNRNQWFHSRSFPSILHFYGKKYLNTFTETLRYCIWTRRFRGNVAPSYCWKPKVSNIFRVETNMVYTFQIAKCAVYRDADFSFPFFGRYFRFCLKLHNLKPRDENIIIVK